MKDATKQIVAALIIVGVFTAAAFTGYIVSWYMFSIAPQENTERVERTVMAVCNSSVITGNYDPCRAAEASSQLTYNCNRETCWTQND